MKLAVRIAGSGFVLAAALSSVALARPSDQKCDVSERDARGQCPAKPGTSAKAGKGTRPTAPARSELREHKAPAFAEVDLTAALARPGSSTLRPDPPGRNAVPRPDLGVQVDDAMIGEYQRGSDTLPDSDPDKPSYLLKLGDAHAARYRQARKAGARSKPAAEAALVRAVKAYSAVTSNQAFGSGQLMYGPQTIGGVINLITRMPPPTPEGHFQVWGGNLNYLNTHFDYGGTWGKSGYLVDYTHSQMDTPRFTNIRAKIDDLTFKFAHELSERTQILAKFNYYRENSGIGYQGLTEADWSLRGSDRQTPFNNDRFDFLRLGYHVAVNHMFTANLASTINLFGHYIQRDWSRQAQQGVDAGGAPVGGVQLGNSLPATAFSVVPANQRFTNEREYWVWGIEPRFHYLHSLLGIKGEADFGARYMYEQSDRKQLRNLVSGLGAFSICVGVIGGGNDSCLGENNKRTTNAYAFLSACPAPSR